MKTPRLVSLCFGILTLATLLHAEPPAVPSEEEKHIGLAYRLQEEFYRLQAEQFPVATAKPEELEKQLARIFECSVKEMKTSMEKKSKTDDPLVQAALLLWQAEFPKADESYDKVLSAKDADPKRLRIAHEGKGIIASIKPDNVSALKHYQSALALYDKDTEPFKWATTARMGSQLLMAQARYKEVEPLVREILRLYEENSGQAKPNFSISLIDLGRVLMHTERLVEAESLIRRALAIDEASLS